MNPARLHILLLAFVVACGVEAMNGVDDSADSGGATGSDRSGFDFTLGESNDVDGFCSGIGATGEPLTIGRCEIAETGNDCTGAADEHKVFVPLNDGDTMRIVVGFQAATMLNFSVRTQGIQPGIPEDPMSEENPIVEVRLFRTSYSVVGRFRDRVPFEPDPDDYAQLVGVDLFVLLGAEVPVRAGQSLTAVATVVDSIGEVRCGSVDFITE